MPTLAARRRLARGGTASRLHRWILLTPLFTSLFLSKWVAPGAPVDFGMAWPLIFAAVLLGMLTGAMRFEPKRLMAYLVLLGLLGGVQVLRGDAFSMTSLILMMAIYLMYALSVPQSRHVDVFRVMSLFATITAICGLYQFAFQFVLPRQFIFPIETLIPKSFLIQNYNYMQPLSYGSRLFKANGIFCLEPSFFSQFMAVAIIAELSMAGRLRQVALYMAGMVVAYSGTGIIILMIALPMVIVVKRRGDILVLGLVGLVVLGLFAEQLNLGLFLERAGEFTNKGSSGFERFTGALYLFEQFLWKDWARALLGFGPGSFVSFAVRADQPVSEMALTKIFFEFGIVGGLATIFFLGYCLTRSQAPGTVKLAVTVMFAMSGIYTAVSHGIALTVLVWARAYQPKAEPDAPTSGRPKRVDKMPRTRRAARQADVAPL